VNTGATPPSVENANRPEQSDIAANIVHGGGWVEGERRLGRPKARLCTIISILWFFPSVGAALILASGSRKWSYADGFVEGLRAVAFEQWVALSNLLAHLVFVGLAWYYRRAEPLREETGLEPNPDRDLRKLR
jgi:hypothetical protein